MMNEQQLLRYKELLTPTADNINEDELLSHIPNLTTTSPSTADSMMNDDCDSVSKDKEMVNKIEIVIEDKKPEYYKLKKEVSLIVLNYLINEGYVLSVDSFSDELGLNLSSGVSSDGSDCGVDQFRNVSAVANEDEDSMSLDDDEGCEFDVDSYFDVDEIKAVETDDDELSTEKYKKITFGLSTIKIRNQIKLLILSGEVEKAIEIITNEFPLLLVTNHLIYFRLLHLNLIEMIRSHRSGENEKEFLNGVLKFINDKLSNFTILQNKKFIKELELTMALLCFGSSCDTSLANGNGNGKATSGPKKRIPLRLQKLLDLKLRNKVANLVNKYIIMFNRSTDHGTSTVEMYHKKAHDLMTARKKPETAYNRTTEGIGMVPFSLLATAAATVSSQDAAEQEAKAIEEQEEDVRLRDKLVDLVKLMLWSFGDKTEEEFVSGLY